MGNLLLDTVRAHIQGVSSGDIPNLLGLYPFKLSPAGEVLAKGLQADIAVKYRDYLAGKIDRATYDQFVAGAIAELNKMAKPDKTFSEHLALGGKVVGGAVVGLLTAGPVGAVTGFIGAAKAIQGQGRAGVTDDVFVTQTPPIVPQNGSTGPATGGNGKGLNPLLIGGGIVAALFLFR